MYIKHLHDGYDPPMQAFGGWLRLNHKLSEVLQVDWIGDTASIAACEENAYDR